jgi:Protein of unknown function (DUF3015)
MGELESMKIIINRVLPVFVAFSALGMSAHAESYGTAGCGLGALAFKDQPGKIQIVAATLNNLISPQTFAITSGTSNCFEDSKSASTLFIQINKQALMKDIARGNGDSLASLSKLLKCSDTDKLGISLQKNYGSIFSTDSASAADISLSIKSTIQNDPSLSKECVAVIS